MNFTTEKSFSQNVSSADLKNKDFDYRLIFTVIISKWYVFIISFIICFGISWIYLKKANRVYEGYTTILLKDPKSKNTLDAQTLIGFNLAKTSSPVENEQIILQSSSLIYNALQRIQWQVSYYVKGRLRTNNSYNNGPYVVIIDTTRPQVPGAIFNIDFIDKDKFVLTSDKNGGYLYKYSTNSYIKKGTESISVPNLKYKKEHKFGDTITTQNFSFVILRGTEDLEFNNFVKYSFNFNSLSKLVNIYQSGITVEPTSKSSSVLKVTFRFFQPEILKDFLNALSAEYIESGLETKNEVAYRTINFIDNELDNIRVLLTNAGMDLETYRKNNKLLDLNDEAQRIFDHMKELDTEKAKLQLKNKYYTYLEEYVESHHDPAFIIVPSAMGIEDPATTELLSEMAKLYSERSALSQSAAVKNPSLQKLDAQIEQLRKNILENTKNNIKLSNISLGDISTRTNTVNSRILSLPTNQRKLFDFQREFDLHNQLYIFLLQKRAEAQITAATNMPDNQVIDPCRNEDIRQIAPKAGLFMISAFLISLLFAFGIVFLPTYLKNTFIFTREIEDMAPFPIAGYIMHNESNEEKVFMAGTNSAVGESFRNLRTNLNFFTGNKKSFVILFTSDMPESGKTFISFNLGHTFAMAGRKTIIVGVDMRRARIHKIFDVPLKPGLSDYLAYKATIDEVIYPTENPYLFILPSGTIPPNPSELLDSSQTDTLLAALRENYNVIILDSPPSIGVTDANILMPKCDINAFIVRIRKTQKNIFMDMVSRLVQRNIPQPVIIVNDVPLRNAYGYVYGYGYGYGYGYESDLEKEIKYRFGRLGKMLKIKRK